MKRPATFSTAAILALMAAGSSLPRLSAQEPPKPGTLITVAGTVKAGFSGDGGPATQALLNGPRGVTFDAAGNLFIADFHNHRVRKVTPDGIITTVAGIGKDGFSGDGDLAVSARLYRPTDLAVNASGDLLISSLAQNRIRRVSPDGIITTVAGNGQAGFSGDGGPATQASLSVPEGIAVDGSGNLFFADTLNYRIRKVDANGIISTVAGGGDPPDGLGDGGPAIQARLGSPTDVAVDGVGNLYISDFTKRRIRKVGRDGIITTVAGTGKRGYSGDGGLATAAQLDSPLYLAVDGVGNLFFTDNRNIRVRKVGTDGIITTVAGTGVHGYTGEGGPATEARLTGPWGVAVDVMGNLYFTDFARLDVTGLSWAGTWGMRVLKVVGVAAPR